MKLRFFSNIYRPKPNEDRMFIHDSANNVVDQFERYEQISKGKVIGAPQATKGMTVEQLKAQGFVGLYIPDTNASDSASTPNEAQKA